MTRTDSPDILTSTLYQDIKISPNSGLSQYSVSSKQCDSQMVGPLDQNFETINKRHCRSFDFIESLDDPKTFSSSMEYPYRSDQQTINKDAVWNGIGQRGHLRYSSPDLFNSRLFQQQISTDKGNDTARTSVHGKPRSKSASRVRATLTPVPITVSPPATMRRRSPLDPQKRPEGLPNRETSHSTNKALVNEVHPIKLQPHTPLYVSDCFEENKQEKQTQANTPHVKCRVDIKPDASVLQHTARKMSTHRSNVPWQLSSASGIRNLSFSSQMPASRTPTPSECYSMDYRPAHQYPNTMSSSYIQPGEVPFERTSPRDPREYRTLSNPNIPTKFFYTDDPCRYPAQPPSRTYYQDDQYSINSSTSQNPSPSNQYVLDPRTRWVHTLPVRSYYGDTHRKPMDAYYNRPYSVSEPGPYFISTPQTETYYQEDPRAYAFPSDPSKMFYTRPCHHPAELHIPMRAYHTEGHRRPRMSQVFSDDWQRSSIATYSSQYASSQATPQRVPPLSPWYPNDFTGPSRLGADVRNYSKSWDNILIPHMDREHGVSRDRSYENLYHHGRPGVPPNNSQQSVILNLSSSPRRYAALSLSENCLEKCAGERQNSAGQHWFVTPEITITDNEIRAVNSSKRNGGSNRSETANTHNLQRHSNPPEPTERKNNNYSLQQSLEQLDELLADLVIDYKPQNSRRPSTDLIDQLKQLIEDDGTKEGKMETDQEDSGLLNTDSSKTSPDTLKDPDSGCEGFQRSVEDISLNHMTDEDDTMVCSNRKCIRKDTTFNACLYFKSCHSCYTYYCSRNCRREDWDIHKESCLHGRISSICRHILKHCRENSEIHKAFSRIARVGYLSRGRGVLFLGFPNPGTADNFLQVGLESLMISPTYLSLRELDSFKDNLGEYCKDLQNAGKEYDPTECFLLNVSIAVGDLVPKIPSPKLQTHTVRKYAKVSLASSSPDKKIFKKECEMETLILTPPPGTSEIDKEGQEGRKAREICFINIQRELRTRGVFLRHEFPQIYTQLCEFVESNKRFTPTTIYPIDKRTGKQFMCMIMAASEPRMLDWVDAPHLLDDII
ncbi:apical junction component 1 homolog [Myxocyprinus asiaticus]|uniref:apical junction component 1 homolog n=1 Tax=Myxocyprinus asiaticus TaxID=70543 RepID=UPI002222575B|nr:apical junction component 1 homolog [Myxocyprinus asiaticus]XP_051525455.1 apical junction component 1 homolog [Myxocyprinus asiaticus]